MSGILFFYDSLRLSLLIVLFKSSQKRSVSKRAFLYTMFLERSENLSPERVTKIKKSYEEVSKKKVVSVCFEQVYLAQVSQIPKHTRGPQIR